MRGEDVEYSEVLNYMKIRTGEVILENVNIQSNDDCAEFMEYLSGNRDGIIQF